MALISPMNKQDAFTPGPWHVETWTYENGKRSRLTVQTATDAIAQTCDLWCPDDRDGEMVANARLIAAAPELYAALTDLLAAQQSDEPSEIALAANAARAVLAKADHAEIG